MANIKISELTSASTLTGTEIIPLVQSGSTVKTTAQDIADLAGGGVSYTSYVAKLVGNPEGNPVTASVLENTTGKTINWTQGSTIGFNNSFPYTTSITGVADEKIVVFALGNMLFFEDKAGPDAKITPVSYQISSGSVSVWFESQAEKLDTEVMVEIRIYP